MTEPAITVLPSIRSAFVAFLRSDVDVLAVTRNVQTEARAPWPCVRVSRVGGVGDPHFLDRALIQVDVWGEPDDKSEAHTDLLALIDRTIAACVEFRLKGSTRSGVRFSGYTVVTLGQQDRDASTRQERVFSRYLLAAHAV